MSASPEAQDHLDRGDAETWTVRELADELGVSTRTLRFYEAEGLIAPERRGTARIYRAHERGRLRLILRGRRLGMSLAEIAEIVDMYDGAATSERRQLELLLSRLQDIAVDLRERQRDLRRTLAEVEQVSAVCRDRLSALGPDASNIALSPRRSRGSLRTSRPDLASPPSKKQPSKAQSSKTSDHFDGG